MLKISVIVPVYNVEKFLPFCLESIINQTYEDLEIILIDDGSTDTSLSICNEYSKKDKRIKVIHQENHGLSHARNVGIENSSCDFLSFIDADDIIAPYFYEYLMNVMQKNNADLVQCSVVKIAQDDVESYRFSDVINKNFHSFDSVTALHYLHDENLQTCMESIVTWNKLYKASLFDNIRFPVGKIHEDEFTTYKLLCKCNNVIHCDAILYGYVQRKSSIMNQSFNLTRLSCALEAYDDYMVFFKNEGLLDLLEKCRRRYLRLLVKILSELEDSEFYDKPLIRKILKDKFDSLYIPDSPDEPYIVVPGNMLQSKLYYYHEFCKLFNKS